MTLELLLVTTVVVLPLLVGTFLLARKLVTLYLNQRDFLDQPYSRAVVWDSSATAKVIGPVMGYDAFEAPLVIFRESATNGGVVLGVRTDRITSYGEVFYSDAACTTSPKVRAFDAKTETTSGSPPVGFAFQMEGRSYAMGNGNILYASSTPKSSGATIDGLLLWVWRSRDVLQPTSCYKPVGLVEDLVDADVVIDFDGAGNYVKPFRLAFPTPGAMPASVSTGG